MPFVTPQAAAEILRSGGIAAFPTETVYGLGANALCAEAVAKVFALKARPSFDPLIVHCKSLDAAQSITHEWNANALKLAESFFPGPLTLVMKKRESIPDIVTAGLNSVGVRMPAHPLARELLSWCEFPVAAPSANPFGRISPTCAMHVVNYFGETLPVIDGGATEVGVESTVVDVSGDQVVLLRPGGISIEQLESATGSRVVHPDQVDVRSAPGQTLRHYAPSVKLTLVPFGEPPNPDKNVACGLLSVGVVDAKGFAHEICLSKSGDLVEVASKLFDALHKMEEMNLDLLVAMMVEPRGIGVAINDRLRRAAAQH